MIASTGIFGWALKYNDVRSMANEIISRCVASNFQGGYMTYGLRGTIDHFFECEGSLLLSTRLTSYVICVDQVPYPIISVFAQDAKYKPGDTDPAVPEAVRANLKAGSRRS